MQVICPSCGCRTECDVLVGLEIPCPWCGRLFVAGDGGDEPAPASVKPYFVQPSARGPGRRGATYAVLCWLGLILCLSIWSCWQHATNGAVDAPGRKLSTQGYVVKLVFSRDGRRLASGGGLYKGI